LGSCVSGSVVDDANVGVDGSRGSDVMMDVTIGDIAGEFGRLG
jgi:hypothetical protein